MDYRKIRVVIPWRHCETRVQGREWVTSWYEKLLGKDCIHFQEDNSDSPFSRSITINKGVEAVNSDIIVIADADCLICDYSLKRAVNEVTSEKMIVPHNSFCITNQQQANWILNQPPSSTRVSGRWFRGKRKRRANGGIWVVTKNLFLEHKVDERFVGWGCEDTELLNRIPYYRFNGPIFHIFHAKKQSKRYWKRNKRLLYKCAEENRTNENISI